MRTTNTKDVSLEKNVKLCIQFSLQPLFKKAYLALRNVLLVHVLITSAEKCLSTMAEQTVDTYFQRFLNRKPTISELFKHVRVGTKWHTFGGLLKLDIGDLDTIDDLDKACDYKTFRMFELWLNTYPNATRREVIQTLQKNDIGESAVAEEYIKALKIIKEGDSSDLLVISLAFPLPCLKRKVLVVCIYQTDSAAPYVVATKEL